MQEIGASKMVKVLYFADDDPEDRSIFIDMMLTVNPSTKIKTFANGLELYQQLENSGELPCCIVLDINMPLWDGLKTLRSLKIEDRYKNIPVCMLTTSQNLLEQKACEQLGAHAFFTKPASVNDFKSIGAYLTTWCQDICTCAGNGC